MVITRPDYPESIDDRLPVEETDRTIASNKVEGTTIYDGDGNRLGEVHNLMIDKYTGQVLYAVMSFGGFLGLGERYHPLPWKALRYDEKLGGYVVGLNRGILDDAPSYSKGEQPPAFTDAYGRGVYGYYGFPFP